MKTPVEARKRLGTLFPRRSTAAAPCASSKLIPGEALRHLPPGLSVADLRSAARNLTEAWRPRTDGSLITNGSSPDHEGYSKHYLIHSGPYGVLMVTALHRDHTALLISPSGRILLQGFEVDERSSPRTLRRVTARLNAAWDALAAWPDQGSGEHSDGGVPAPLALASPVSASPRAGATGLVSPAAA